MFATYSGSQGAETKPVCDTCGHRCQHCHCCACCLDCQCTVCSDLACRCGQRPDPLKEAS